MKSKETKRYKITVYESGWVLPAIIHTTSLKNLESVMEVELVKAHMEDQEWEFDNGM